MADSGADSGDDSDGIFIKVLGDLTQFYLTLKIKKFNYGARQL